MHVYLEKTGALPDEDSNAKMWGRRLEDLVAEAYREETGRPVYKPARPIERHKTLPWMLASLDRLTEVDGGGRVLECKTSRYDGDEWGTPDTDEVPPHYVLQCQHQLAVTGMKACDLAVLFGGQEFRTYTIHRDDGLIAKLERVLSDFWGKVQRHEAPELDWEHPATPDLVLACQKVNDEKVVEVAADHVQLVVDYLSAREVEATFRKKKRLIQARLADLLGDAKVGVFSSGHVVRRSKVTRGSYEVEGSEYFLFTVKEPK